jgi:hypothetical protein
MHAMIARCPVARRHPPVPSVAEQIADFLEGRNNGDALLHALYDHVLDEPIPESMRRLLRNARK